MLSMTKGIPASASSLDDVVALVVRAVEDAEVGPLALRFFLRVAEDGDQVGALGVFAGENDHRQPAGWEVACLPLRASSSRADWSGARR